MGTMAWRSQRGIAQTTILLQQTPGEKKVANVLQSALAPNKLSVKDISGTVHTDSPICSACIEGVYSIPVRRVWLHV